MSLSREQVCQQTSQKLSVAAKSLNSIQATIGLDGFVDEIIGVVDKRHSHDRVDWISTIEQFGRKVLNASGQSSNYELVVKQMKLGGNGPIMANALAAVGMGVTYIGALGYPNVHPVFDEFARRAKVVSIGEAGHTDALEFSDGKLMLGKVTQFEAVNWSNLIARVGRDRLHGLISTSRLIGMVNWTMLPFMSEIWAKLQTEILQGIQRDGRTFFVDLADPEKRTHDDIRGALDLLTKFQQQLDVILGLNLKESLEIAHVLGLPEKKDPEAALEELASSIREKLKIACVVIHPRRGAAAAIEGQTARFAGPFVQQPKISTGAGDHFNAGFCLGRILGFSLEESLCTGVATSGYYVRNAASPTAAQLAQFIADLPAPEA